MRFDVTAQTIRRDLTELCDAGKLERVYGGALLSSGVANIGYEDRRMLYSNEKDRDRPALRPQHPRRCLDLPQHRHQHRSGGT